MLLATFLEQSKLDVIADHEHGTQRAREIGKIKRRHLLQPRHLTKRMVVSEQARLQDLRCAHQASIHAQIDIVAALMNGQFHIARALKIVQNLETAPAALALGRIARIGERLQLAQDKSRHDQRATEKTGCAKLGDASIDNDVGIENKRLVLSGFTGETDIWDDERKLIAIA